jgi:hypothetical protein
MGVLSSWTLYLSNRIKGSVLEMQIGAWSPSKCPAGVLKITKAVKTCQIPRIEWMAEFIGLISDLSCVEPVKELTWAKGQCFTLIVCCCSFFYRCCSCYPLWFGLLVPECMWAPAITRTLSFTFVQVFKAKLVSLVLSVHCWLGYVHFFCGRTWLCRWCGCMS